MQYKRTLFRIAGAATAALSLLFLTPAIILLNQQLHIVPMLDRWGIFDPAINGVPLSNSAAEAIFGIVGLVLFAIGSLLFLWPRRRPA